MGFGFRVYLLVLKGIILGVHDIIEGLSQGSLNLGGRGLRLRDFYDSRSVSAKMQQG